MGYGNPDIVDLHPAWVFDCPECGIENFVRSVISGMTAEEEKEYRENYDLSEDEIGYWQTAPTTVECQDCGIEFDVNVDLPESG